MLTFNVFFSLSKVCMDLAFLCERWGRLEVKVSGWQVEMAEKNLQMFPCVYGKPHTEN